jgi:hypothetical protein
MKYKRAIIIFGPLTLLVAGYTAWCMRCFYLPVKLEFPPDTPPDVRAQFEDWHARTHLNLTRDLGDPLARELLLKILMHPGDREHRAMRAYRAGGGITYDPPLWLVSGPNWIHPDGRRLSFYVTVRAGEPAKAATRWTESLVILEPSARSPGSFTHIDQINSNRGRPLPENAVELLFKQAAEWEAEKAR